MSNNVYTVKVLGCDLKQDDVVVRNNKLHLVYVKDDRLLLSTLSPEFELDRERDVVRDMWYSRVTVGEQPATSPSKSKPTIAATNSDVESFIDIRAY